MRKILITLIAFTFLFSSCGTKPETEVDANSNYPYYVVKDSSGNDVGYMLGTMHIGKKEMAELPENVKDGLSNATVLHTEVEADYYLNPQKYSALVQKYLYLEDGASLYDEMTEEQIKMFNEKVATYPGEDMDYSKMTRMAVYSYLTNQSGDLSALYGIDMKVMKMADLGRMQSVPFETVEEQMQMLTTIQEMATIDTWVETMPTYEENVAANETLFSIYTENKIEENFDELFENNEASELLLKNRNLMWLPQINAQLKDGDTFFILVGTGHLYGEYGLINLLEEQGYTVERVS